MPVPPASTPPGASLLAAFFILVSLAVYGRMVRRIAREGGKVQIDQLDLPELLMTLVFALFFGWATATAALHHGHEGRDSDVKSVLPSALVFVAFVIGISGFLRFRGLDLRRTFGLDRVSLPGVVGWACGLILAAFPLAFAANALTLLVSHSHLEPQPLVDLFNKVAAQHDYSAMSKIIFSAVIVAPACEEFLFRGFFYAVWKRYLGPLGAGILASLLFAAFHSSLAALAGLFVLAVCLNVAYERTGSLLVPIAMHALFNLTSLLVMLAQAQTGATP